MDLVHSGSCHLTNTRVACTYCGGSSDWRRVGQRPASAKRQDIILRLTTSGGCVRDLHEGRITSSGFKQAHFCCRGLTKEGFWVDDAEEDENSKKKEGDPGNWWKEQWFAAQNLAALEVLARMKDVPGVNINAQSPKPRWKSLEARASPWEKPEVHGRTALSLAAERGDSEAVRLLVSLG
eukprot:6842207-Pyramimonas_sp.AAC.1